MMANETEGRARYGKKSKERNEDNGTEWRARNEKQRKKRNAKTMLI